jgi:hypothetical protein
MPSTCHCATLLFRCVFVDFASLKFGRDGARPAIMAIDRKAHFHVEIFECHPVLFEERSVRRSAAMDAECALSAVFWVKATKYEVALILSLFSMDHESLGIRPLLAFHTTVVDPLQ